MHLRIRRSTLAGEVRIPASKSHTIRAVAIAALASGESVIRHPLDSSDARAARRAYSMLGAAVDLSPDCWRVRGTGGALSVPEDVISVDNSGTTMLIALGSAALLRSGVAVLTGDAQVRRRPCGPLLGALSSRGALPRAPRHNGVAPVVRVGFLSGGAAVIEAVTSQYISSLLLNAPLAEGDTRLFVPLLNEKPYVHMTLDWLHRHGVRAEHNDDLSEFHIAGGQSYNPVDRAIPGDFSSAAFFLAAGALPNNTTACLGLDMNDTQGDKAIVSYLQALGAEVVVEEDRVQVRARALRGCELDLNATPDALPMLAALACFAEGQTRLVNVPQARLKETDRIRVMRIELEKLGARISELEDGLVIEGGALHGAEVEGHDDHRVVMALAVAASAIDGDTIIRGAEAIDVTYPSFVQDFESLGACVSVNE